MGGLFIMSEMQKCNTCNDVLPLIAEFWHRDGIRSKGFKGDCKKCRNLKKREYNKQNKEKIAKRGKQYRLENKEAIKKQGLEYREKNKKQILKQQKEYRDANRRRVTERNRKWYNDNTQLCKDRALAWAKENPDKINARAQRRRNKKMELPHTLTVQQWLIIKNDFNNQCAYCGMSEEEHLELYKEQLHQDHFIALSKGGGYTHNNIIPSCRSCNARKNNISFFEWYKECVSYDKERENFILEYLGYENKNIQQLALFL